MFKKRNRSPLTMEERAQMYQLVAEGQTSKEIGVLMGRPTSTIQWNRAHSTPQIAGTPNACQCGQVLRQTTDNGYRVEACPAGCELTPNLGYLMEFRVR